MVRQGKSGATARKPVSPIYRRRRLFVGAVLLLVLAIAVGGLVTLSNAFNDATPASTARSPQQEKPGPSQPAGNGSASPTASAGATPSPTSGCNEQLLTVSAATDKAAYGPGENPLLTLKVTNGNRVPCEVNIGTSQMEYLITSGSDRIFSSRDCQAESTDLVKTIAPGMTETANFPWDGKRSTAGCKVVDAQPAAGTYIFTARLGDKTSPKAVFQLG
jgi:hypothetical protein